MKDYTSPLQNIKIADLSWSVVGPEIALYLSYYGAEVVKLESLHTPEVTRRSSPFKDGISTLDRSLVFPIHNTNKYSLSINLKHPKGRAIALRLVSWADIVIQSTTSNTLEKLKLTYSDLREVNERLIVLVTSNQGQTGPYSSHPGYGDSVVALAGFPEVTGWPDRAPSLPPAAYSDAFTPWFGTLAVLSALEYRNRTGKGQLIDLAQLEAAANMLTPAFLAYSANNSTITRMGNRSQTDAPHGVYRCLGDDRWCAIAITSEEEWRDFTKVLGEPDWARAHKFSSMTQRKRNEDELDKLIETWTSKHTAEEVMIKLQANHIAAGIVQNVSDLHRDPQLMHRGHFQTISHPEIDKYTIELPPYRLSENHAELRRPAPLLGKNTEYVCCNLLKMSGEEFAQLYSEGVFE
jgi:crotonobetainyl-CoA:carnitine CoA-transferase CaiB-like acyl-CoA transferase